MVVLEVHKEGDVTSKILYTFHNGSHFIGRETPIKLNDNRISRKHACLTVHKNGVNIKSVHINPTFFKSSIGGPIQILKEHESLTLNNGDSFALLEDSTWFKVKITYENDESIINNDVVNKKRVLDEHIPESAKRIKIEPTESSNITVENNVCADRTVSCNPSESSNENQLENTTELHENVSNMPENCETSAANDMTIECDKANEEHLPNINEIDTENPNAEPIPQMPVPLAAMKAETLDCDSTLHIPMLIPKTEIKLEPPDGSASTSSGSTNIKKEPAETPGANQPCSSTSDEIPAWKRDHPNWRRDRCWYGSSCYRKNPLHKEDLSHPGDNDYDSDPNDNRPVCPFNRCCYRLNIQHRREYKHFGKPVQKPNGPNVNIQVHLNGCQCCRNRKPGYESDHDAETDPE